MASVNDWNKYLNVLHELAQVEDRLRFEQANAKDQEARNILTHILYVNFGVYP